MQIIKIKFIAALAVLLSVASFAPASAPAADDLLPPDLPCTEIQVPAGHRLSYHTYALGVQRYRWNGTAWAFVEPVARLFANETYRGEVGTHYAGPAWESNSGSKVVAARINGCSVDPTAIDWLLLQAVSNEGNGPFRRVTYIQRVNTVGGKAPIAPGSITGAIVDVPYTTEYYFYRAEH